jgi:hypothetical protein
MVPFKHYCLDQVNDRAALAPPAGPLVCSTAVADKADMAVTDPSTLKAYMAVQNGSDVRGVALDSKITGKKRENMPTSPSFSTPAESNKRETQ